MITREVNFCNLDMFLKSFELLTLICTVDIVSSGTIPKSLISIQPSSLDSGIVEILNSKNYIPSDVDLPKLKEGKSDDRDAEFVLSKLSDEELLKVLSETYKEDEAKTKDVTKDENKEKTNDDENNRTQMYIPQAPVFKLDHKEVDPYAESNNVKDNAYTKIKNILYSHPQDENPSASEEKKEMLFDILVAQLKSLCCKKKKRINNNDFEQFLNKIIQKKQKKSQSLDYGVQRIYDAKEYIFLVINDEIVSNTNDDLILVDPDSLSNNSSVLLLGPINTPLKESELKLVITRISNELSRPEYLPLLLKLSDGTLADSSDLINSVITGPGTRRYIKPHRCNHQSKLARIYGGPKWLICTGYLNLNKPSLYD